MDSNRHQKKQFWKLAEPEYQPLYRFCCRLIGSEDDGADLCQDVLVRARQGFDRLKDHQAFKGWLYRIAVNEFKTRIKRPWWTRVVPMDDQIIAGLTGVNPVPRLRANRLLRIGFQKISAEDQALIVMFEVENWSVKELAQMCGKTETATRMRLSRIRGRIRERLIKHLKSKRNESKHELTVNELISEDEICIATKPNSD